MSGPKMAPTPDSDFGGVALVMRKLGADDRDAERAAAVRVLRSTSARLGATPDELGQVLAAMGLEDVA